MSAFTPTLPALSGSTPGAVGSLPSAAGTGSTLASLAERLAMTADTLQSALRQGQSIAGLAEQQGVPRQAVAELVAGQIQQARSWSGQPPLEDGALARTVDRALDRGRPAGSAGGDGDSESGDAQRTGMYASNARVAAGGLPPGQTISLLA